MKKWRICFAACALALCANAWGAQYRGQVMFGGQPLPGAVVTATQNGKTLTAIADENGYYFFQDIAEGSWKIRVTMQLFAPVERTVTVAAETPADKIELSMLPLTQLLEKTKVTQAYVAAPVEAPAASKKGGANQSAAPEAPRPQEDQPQASNNGLLINGSVNNAATSQYTLAPAFGNARNGGKGLYTGGASLILNNSAFNARPYSLSGQSAPKPQYSDVTTVLTLGGPIRIPHLMPRGPNFFVVYQWTRDSNDQTLSGLVPTDAQRAQAIANTPAAALLAYYPTANVLNNPSYNYQRTALTGTHQDAMQSRLDKQVSRKDQIYGSFSFQNSREDSENLFGFVDKTDVLGWNGKINWIHRWSTRFFFNTGFQVSRLRTQVAPFFANRVDIAGAAKITGVEQNTPRDWGPPSLVFSSGIAGLSDANSAFNRNRTDGVSEEITWYHGKHNITAGGDFRRQEFNVLAQQNPRGTFTFNGAATGSDFGDFIAGKADTSTAAFGNADKYLRQSVYDLYATDDWRVTPELTINAGLRWEYGAPMTELFNRLVNIDVASGFAGVAPVLAAAPQGTLSGQRYPSSLIRPDRLGIQPRVGISWRPIPGSTVVVRAGYGVYDDTSVYRATVLQMAQQYPLSKSPLVNYATCAQTFDVALAACPSVVSDPFGVDPNFRVGYAQTWQLSVQRDLPGSLQMLVSYLGIKGTRGMQEFLPNTYPVGGTDPCPQCPKGFAYRTSNGDSTREQGSAQIRRRLKNGFTATVQYTYSKSIDNDAMLGGQGPSAPGVTSQASGNVVIAQNWRDLRAERSRSSFDQRHLLTATIQYTTGQGIGGGTLMSGWRGVVLKEWTGLAQITAGSGLPETPVYLATVPGTATTGPLRPSLAGGSLYAAPKGFALNAAAYAVPAAGVFGNAGRNSINGPNQFTFNFSLSRTFRIKSKLNLDIRADAQNVLNHVTFTSWNTVLSPLSGAGYGQALSPALNPTFGLPAAANEMRSMQLTTRLRF